MNLTADEVLGQNDNSMQYLRNYFAEMYGEHHAEVSRQINNLMLRGEVARVSLKATTRIVHPNRVEKIMHNDPTPDEPVMSRGLVRGTFREPIAPGDQDYICSLTSVLRFHEDRDGMITMLVTDDFHDFLAGNQYHIPNEDTGKTLYFLIH